MVGVLIVCHGSLGNALLRAATHVLGAAPPQVQVIEVAPSDERDALLEHARAAARTLDTGDGLLVLTDMYGATPANIAVQLLERGRIEGVSGISLPMLVRALANRDEPLAVLLERALSGGAQGVLNMNSDCCCNG